MVPNVNPLQTMRFGLRNSWRTRIPIQRTARLDTQLTSLYLPGRTSRNLFTDILSRSKATRPSALSSIFNARHTQRLYTTLLHSFRPLRTLPPRTIIQNLRSRLLSTTSRLKSSNTYIYNPTPFLGSPPVASTEPLTLGARMRKLSREYGWAALGVYLLLTAIDLPLCYLLVRWLGTDRVGKAEAVVIGWIESVIPEGVREGLATVWGKLKFWGKKAELAVEGGGNGHGDADGWGVDAAEKANKRDASLATQLALAYAIHKSFIFIRVPITVSITPNVVRVLRGWGWDIGKRTTKETKVANAREVMKKRDEASKRRAERRKKWRGEGAFPRKGRNTAFVKEERKR